MGEDKSPMIYLKGLFFGVLLAIVIYTANGQVPCRTSCVDDTTRTCFPMKPTDYYCECNEGYRLNEALECEDINECQWNVCGSLKCQNFQGTYDCDGDKCGAGYRRQTPQSSCNDIDECIYPVCGPSGTCKNYQGFYSCDCYSGYELVDDGRYLDTDECSIVNICGSSSAGQCINTQGSYTCQCLAGYQLVNNTCEVISIPTHGLPGCVESCSEDTDKGNSTFEKSKTSESGEAGQVIGIAVGVFVGAIFLVLIGVIISIRYWKKRRSEEEYNRNSVYDNADFNDSGQQGPRNDNTTPISSPAGKGEQRHIVAIKDRETFNTYEEIFTHDPVSKDSTIPKRVDAEYHDFMAISEEEKPSEHSTEGTTEEYTVPKIIDDVGHHYISIVGKQKTTEHIFEGTISESTVPKIIENVDHNSTATVGEQEATEHYTDGKSSESTVPKRIDNVDHNFTATVSEQEATEHYTGGKSSESTVPKRIDTAHHDYIHAIVGEQGTSEQYTDGKPSESTVPKIIDTADDDYIHAIVGEQGTSEHHTEEKTPDSVVCEAVLAGGENLKLPIQVVD